MVNTGLLVIALVAFLGGITFGLLGFLGTSDRWDWRKFLATLITSLVAGITVAAAWESASDAYDWRHLFLAFLSGSAIDTARKRIAGAIEERFKR